jgi:hypothetical protein
VLSGGRAPTAPPLRPAFGTPPRRLLDPHSRGTRRYRRTRPHRRYATTPSPSRLLDTRSHGACRRHRTRPGPHRATTPSPSSPLQPNRIPVDDGYPQMQRTLLPCLGFSEPWPRRCRTSSLTRCPAPEPTSRRHPRTRSRCGNGGQQRALNATAPPANPW